MRGSGYSKTVFARPTDYVIRPLTPRDEPILWEMLYHGLSEPAASKPASRDILRRPEISKYVAGWGRPGDIGFVAHEKRGGALIGAVWLRQPTDTSGAVPELALAVKQEHRGHGIATALLRSAQIPINRQSQSASSRVNRYCVFTSDSDSRSLTDSATRL